MSVQINIVEEFLKFLIILFPFLLVTGPFLPDITAVFIAIFYFIYLIKQKNFSDFKNYLIFFLLIFFLYINFNSIFSFDPIISFNKTIPYIRVILFILGLAYIIKKYNKVLPLFFYSSLLCYLLLVVDSSFQFLFGKNLVGIELKNNSRISSFFGDEYIMGSFVSRLLPVLLGLSYLIKNNNIKLIRFFLIIISFLLVIFSGERLATIFLIITIFFYFYFDFNNKKIFIFFIIMGLFFSLIPKHHNTFINRIFIHSYNQFKETGNIIKFSYRHYLHYYTAYKMFLDNKLLGQGVKSFRYLCDLEKFSVKDKIIRDNTIVADKNYFIFSEDDSNRIKLYLTDDKNFDLDNVIKYYDLAKKEILKNYLKKNQSEVKRGDPIISFYEYSDGCNTHPHNFYMQFLAELGVFGLVFLIIAFIFSFFNLMKIMFKRIKVKITSIEYFNAFFYVGIFINLFPFLPSGNFFNNWLLLLVHLPAGFYIALNKNKLANFK